MPLRRIAQRIGAMSVSEGAGVRVRRSIGLPTIRHLDPFLLLDCFSTDDPREYLAGFPDHPHRGFVTFTYMIEGHMLHRDSLGNRGDLQSGGAQWMKAARGVIHSEMPQQTEGRLRGFQLWINLPATEKMSQPAYQEFGPDAFPVIERPGASIKVLLGAHGEQRSPIEDPITQVRYLDLTLEPGAAFREPLDAELQGFIYCFEGELNVEDRTLRTHELGVLSEGEAVQMLAGPAGTRCILVAGHPIGEPIVQHGPFVMNSREEIEQALADYRQGRLVDA